MLGCSMLLSGAVEEFEFFKIYLEYELPFMIKSVSYR